MWGRWPEPFLDFPSRAPLPLVAQSSCTASIRLQTILVAAFQIINNIPPRVEADDGGAVLVHGVEERVDDVAHRAAVPQQLFEPALSIISHWGCLTKGRWQWLLNQCIAIWESCSGFQREKAKWASHPFFRNVFSWAVWSKKWATQKKENPTTSRLPMHCIVMCYCWDLVHGLHGRPVIQPVKERSVAEVAEKGNIWFAATFRFHISFPECPLHEWNPLVGAPCEDEPKDKDPGHLNNILAISPHPTYISIISKSFQNHDLDGAHLSPADKHPMPNSWIRTLPRFLVRGRHAVMTDTKNICPD